MVDVEQHGMEKPPGLVRIETVLRIAGEGEEIAVDQAAARVAGELPAEGNQSSLMPLDHRIQRLDDEERAHRGIPERGDRCVAQPQTADHHVPLPRVERREAEIGERDFDFVEEARHEESVPELHFEDFHPIERGDSPAPQGQISERRFAEVEFSEVGAHVIGISGPGPGWCGP